MKQGQKQFDVIVVGAGAGGLTVAVGMAAVGKRVALVEAKWLGGECANAGCVPSKALIHAAAGGMGRVEAMEYVRGVVKGINREEKELLGSDQIEYIKGWGRLLGEGRVRVELTKGGKRVFEARKIVVATGSHPKVIEVKGLPKKRLYTNENIFSLKQVPERMVVMGVGAMGVELAQAFARLGTQVKVLYRGSRILRNEDEDAAKAVERALVADGVGFYWQVDKVEWKRGGVEFLSAGKEERVDNPEVVLMALGREANIKGLGLERAGVEVERNGIVVDKKWRTSAKGVLAIGDVVDGERYTHVANEAGRAVVKSLLMPALPASKMKVVPRVVYTSPEVATVGKSVAEIEAVRNLLMEVKVGFEEMDRGKTDGVSRGFVRIWARRLSGRIERVSVVGENAGETVSFFVLAMSTGVSMWKLSSLVLPYPTLSQAFKRAGDVFAKKTLGNIQSEVVLVVGRRVGEWRRKYAVKVVGVLVWLGLFLWSRQYMQARDLTFLGLAGRLAGVVGGGVWGVMIYMGVYLLRPVIFFPAGLLTILAGVVFGLKWGFVYALIAGTVSAVVPYAMGRWFGGGGAVNSKRSGGLWGKYAGRVRESTFETVLLMRLLYLPYDVVSLLVGGVGASFVAFMAATALGNVLGTLTYVGVGASLEGDLASGEVAVNYRVLAMSLVLALVGMGVSRVMKKYRRT